MIGCFNKDIFSALRSASLLIIIAWYREVIAAFVGKAPENIFATFNNHSKVVLLAVLGEYEGKCRVLRQYVFTNNEIKKKSQTKVLRSKHAYFLISYPSSWKPHTRIATEIFAQAQGP